MPSGNEPPTIEPLHPMAAEFGKPQWTFSMVTYAFAGARRIAASYVQDGRWKLAFVETDPVRWEPVNAPLDVLEGLRADERALYFFGGSPTAPLGGRPDDTGGDGTGGLPARGRRADRAAMDLGARTGDVHRSAPARHLTAPVRTRPHLPGTSTPSTTRLGTRTCRRRREPGRRCSS